jgi:hypothetical protein
VSASSKEKNSTIDDEQPFKNKHPKLYERKTKVTGNDTFLKQIFS